MHIGVKMSCPSLLHTTFSQAQNGWKPVAYSKCSPKRGAQSVRRSVMMGLMAWGTVSNKTCEISHTTSLTCSLPCHVTGCIISIMSVVCLHFYLCHPLNFPFFASGCLPTSFTLAHPNQMSHPQHTPLPRNTPRTSLRALYRWTRRSRPARVDYVEWTKSLYSYFNAKKAPGRRWSKCRCWLGAGTFPTILSLQLCLYELNNFRMAAHSWLSKNSEGNLLHKAPYIPSVQTTYHLLHRGTYRNKLFLSWPDSTQWLTQLAELPVPHLPKQYSEPLIGRTVGL